MSIIGWDIGIKNLAFCKLHKLSADDVQTNITSLKNIIKLNDSYYQIENWEVVNIVPKVSEIQKNTGEIMLGNRPIVLCNCKQKSGKICGKKAAACDITTNNGIYNGYCSTHFKSVAPKNTVSVKNNTCECQHRVVDGKCEGKVAYVLADNNYYGYCRPHGNLLLKAQSSSSTAVNDKVELLKVVRNKKTTSLNLTALADALYQELDTRPYLMQTHTVLLENQPVLKNPTMKTMQIFLYGYYVQNGIRRNSTSEIHCYSASKKLDLIKFLPTERVQTIVTELKTIKGQYSRNKRMAVRLCEYMLENAINADELRSIFSDKKKQDDLADSLLMTLHQQERKTLEKMKTKTGAKNVTLTKEEQAFINELLSSLEEPEAPMEDVALVDSD
jgi:hypothetical protein